MTRQAPLKAFCILAIRGIAWGYVLAVTGGGALGRFLDWVERVGNRLPHPFLIFVYLALFVVGLGVAAFLRRFEDDLNGRYTLLFQPSEEGSRGAGAMVEKGCLDDADYFIAGHLGMSVNELGVVAATTVGFLPTTKLDVHFRGRAAHAGGAPQEGRNALLAAATTAVQLHAIPRHREGETRIHAGTLHAGTGRNVVPDRAAMQVETRGATEDLDAYVAAEARRIIDAAAAMHGVEVVGRGPGATCDGEWKKIVAEACEGARFVGRVVPEANIGGSEDATVMIGRVQERGGKATYMVFGSPLAAGHHNLSFDWDEDALLVAVEVFGRVVACLSATDGDGDVITPPTRSS